MEPQLVLALVLGHPIGPVTQEACLNWSVETVLGTYRTPVGTGEEVSGRGKGPDLGDDDLAGRFPHVNLSWRPLPSTIDGIKKRWPETYRLDCSVLGMPLVGQVTESRSWRSNLRGMPQNNNTCSLKASTQAIEGMHSVVYEEFHEPNKFPDAWKAADDWTDQLLRTMGNGKEEVEGFIVGDVLSKIRHGLRGVRTASGKGFQMVMPLNNFTKHSGDKLTWKLAVELLDKGPCIGRLCVCPWWGCFDASKNPDWVYRGIGRDNKVDEADCKEKYPKDKGLTGSHAVVCFAYRLVRQNGKVVEMHVCVLDNHSKLGPERWVAFEELDAMFSLEVDCLCGPAAHHPVRS